MKSLVLKLKENKGLGVAVEMSLFIIVCMIMLSMSISMLKVFAVNSRMNLVASELARYIEITGEIGSSTDSEFNRLVATANLPGATVDYSTLGRIQLEDEFTVTVYTPYKVGIGNLVQKEKTYKVEYTGRSEVYWK